MSNLINNKLWIEGPFHLIEFAKAQQPYSLKSENFGHTCQEEEFVREIKPTPIISLALSLSTEILSLYSNLSRLKRVMVYILRFIHNSKKCQIRVSGILTVDELDEAMNNLIRLSQRQYFSHEY